MCLQKIYYLWEVIASYKNWTDTNFKILHLNIEYESYNEAT